ncbi:MAG: hypothetical protein ABJB49_04975, partial [Nitrospirota bacterium]
MRPTISVKIFSIAVGLLILMAIVTGLSGLNLKKVNNEVVALAAYYVPLEQRMDHIDSAVRDELIHLGRLMQLYQAKSDDVKTIEEEKRKLEEHAGKVDQEVAEALQLVERVLASSEIEVNREEFATLRKQLPDIAAAHNLLHETAILLLTERQQGDERSVRAVRDVIRKQRDSIDKTIGDVTASLQAMTRESAKKAERLELRAIKVNWGITIGASV